MLCKAFWQRNYLFLWLIRAVLWAASIVLKYIDYGKIRKTGRDKGGGNKNGEAIIDGLLRGL